MQVDDGIGAAMLASAGNEEARRAAINACRVAALEVAEEFRARGEAVAAEGWEVFADRLRFPR